MKLEYIDTHFTVVAIKAFLENHATTYGKTRERPTGRYYTLITIIRNVYFQFTPLTTTVAIALRSSEDPPDHQIVLYHLKIEKQENCGGFWLKKN
jgi:hypothetical protein